jgi:PilZ domain
MTPPERRASPRIRSARPVEAHLALDANVLFISTSGMAVRLPFAPSLGSRQGFSLMVGGRAFDITGVVRNVAPKDDEGDAFDVGVEFEGLTPAQEQMIEQFVAEKLKKG